MVLFSKEKVRFSKLFELSCSLHETEHSTGLSENEIKSFPERPSNPLW